MGHNEELLKNVREVVERINDLRDLAYAQYLPAVDEVLAGRITDKNQIEHILDGILTLPSPLLRISAACRGLHIDVSTAL